MQANPSHPTISGCTGDWSLGKETFEWIESHIEPGGRILEFGSGRGTERLSRNYSVTSIEHDEAWLNRFDSNYVHAPIVNDWYDVNVLMKAIRGPYDLIIVDGPPGKIGRSGVIRHFNRLGLQCGCPVIVDDAERKGEAELSRRLSVLGYMSYQIRESNKCTDILLPETIQLFSCVGCDFDVDLLQHFVNYYRPHVDGIKLLLHSKHERTPGFVYARRYLDELGIEYEPWVGPFTSLEKTKRLFALVGRHALPYSWLMHADMDEQQAYPESIRNSLAKYDQQGISVVRGVLMERGTSDGTLPAILPDTPLSQQFPTEFTTAPGVSKRQKVCATRGFLPPVNCGWHYLGADYPGRRRSPTRIPVMHYRWHATTMAAYSERMLMLQNANISGLPSSKHFGASQLITDYLFETKGRLRYVRDPQGNITVNLTRKV